MLLVGYWGLFDKWLVNNITWVIWIIGPKFWRKGRVASHSNQYAYGCLWLGFKYPFFFFSLFPTTSLSSHSIPFLFFITFEKKNHFYFGLIWATLMIKHIDLIITCWKSRHVWWFITKIEKLVIVSLSMIWYNNVC